MIGGQDIRIGVPSGAIALDFALRTLMRRWPDAVFVADNEEKLVTRYEDLALHETTEVVVYKDEEACRAWRRLGYDPSLRGTMFYLISDPGDLTIVVEDDPPLEARLVLGAIVERVPALFRLAQLEEAA